MDDHDPVNHPAHYTARVPGIECIDVAQHFGFLRGNAIKYLWRAGAKNHDARQDLQKARWYIDRELAEMDKPVPPGPDSTLTHRIVQQAAGVA